MCSLKKTIECALPPIPIPASLRLIVASNPRACFLRIQPQSSIGPFSTLMLDAEIRIPPVGGDSLLLTLASTIRLDCPLSPSLPSHLPPRICTPVICATSWSRRE